ERLGCSQLESHAPRHLVDLRAKEQIAHHDQHLARPSQRRRRHRCFGAFAGRISRRDTSTESGCVTRYHTASAIWLLVSFQLWSPVAGVRKVSTDPGITTATRTLESRTSSISDSVNPFTACLVAA